MRATQWAEMLTIEAICVYFLGIVNRCHLVEMNQATNTCAYIPIGQNILCNMGLGSTAVSVDKLQEHAVAAKGSIRNYINLVLAEGVKLGGVMTV